MCDYFFSPTAEILIVQKTIQLDSIVSQNIEWVSLKQKKIINIWHGSSVANLVFDNSGTGIAFAKEGYSLNAENEVWFYGP